MSDPDFSPEAIAEADEQFQFGNGKNCCRMPVGCTMTHRGCAYRNQDRRGPVPGPSTPDPRADDEMCTCQKVGTVWLTTSCDLHNPFFGVQAQAQEAIGQPVRFVGLGELLKGEPDV